MYRREMKLQLIRMISIIIGLFVITPSVNPGYLAQEDIEFDQTPSFLSVDSSWADSVLLSMNLEEKIAQLLMVQAYSNRDDDHFNDLRKLVNKHKIGGLVFFQGKPEKQAMMTNKLQEASKTPLLIAMDAEWGLGMRLENVISYPRQMMLGAIQDNELIFRMGTEIAQQLKDLGVHMNFAPVADINNNPKNPVINTRSFGEDRENVSAKVNALFSGMQSEGILVTAKHFPGHGDTDTDSHLDLPLINFSRNRLDSLELYPFKMAINKGLSGIMIAHLHVPVLDSRENRPTTLSHNVVSNLLKKELGFKGLIVTDAMNMKGVSANFDPGESELEALKAGNDILLMPSDVPKVISIIKRAVKKGDIEEARIDSSCYKILLAKSWLGLDSIQPVYLKDLDVRLNARKYLPLKEELAEKAITLVKDDDNLLPLKDMSVLQMVSLNLGIKESSSFTETLDLYHSGDHLFFETQESFPADTVLRKQLLKYNTLILSLYYTKSYGKNFGIPEGVKDFIDSIDFDGRIILNLFGYPYAIESLGELTNIDALIVSYTDDIFNQQKAAQGIFGGISFLGKLPVSIGNRFAYGTGIITKGGNRLAYSLPENVSMNIDSLKQIDEIVNEAIRDKAMPGCQIVVARKGAVVWKKSYGYHTYRNKQKVKDEHLYDLASITKIASTIPSLMKLQDKGIFNVDSSLGYYYPGIDSSDKGGLRIRDILTHQAGLRAWIPFYTSTLEPLDTSQSLFNTNFSYTYPYKMGPAAYANRNIVFKDSIFQSSYSAEYPIHVAKDLYMRPEYRDSIYNKILESPLGEANYLYSDLGYYFLYKTVEYITDTMFYPYTWYNFYAPLGAESMGFLPLNRFEKSMIIPTENDMVFRKQLIQGHVHDPGAAMLGGICGHAGLFSNANDLAKLMQMYLNNGSYGGKKYIDSAIIAEYTRCQFCDLDNRRAMGFDRPMSEEDAGPACNSASERSYGHTGFTGTIAWVDPEYDLIYIFLSNRIQPNQDNTLLISSNVRTRIQEILYKSIEDR